MGSVTDEMRRIVGEGIYRSALSTIQSPPR